MSSRMYGSGKFVSPVSHAAPSPTVTVEPGISSDQGKNVDIGRYHEVPPVPKASPAFIQYAEKYFGKYWFVTLLVLLFLLFHQK